MSFWTTASSKRRPIRRFTAWNVFCGLVTAWRLAGWPTRISPSLVNATTEGVVRSPSLFSMTLGDAAFHDGHAGVGGAEVDSDDLGHVLVLRKVGLVSVVGTRGAGFQPPGGASGGTGSAETMTRAGRSRRPFRSQPFCTTWSTVWGGMVGRGLHGHRIVLRRVEGLAGRVDGHEAGAFERLQQEPERRFLALAPASPRPQPRRTPSRAPSAVHDRQEIGGEPLDAVLPGGVHFARRRACGNSRSRRSHAGNPPGAARRAPSASASALRPIGLSGDCPSSGTCPGCLLSDPFMRAALGLSRANSRRNPACVPRCPPPE